MTRKTIRTVYLNDDLDDRLLRLAEQDSSSVCRVVRIALEQLLEINDMNKNDQTSGKTRAAMASWI